MFLFRHTATLLVAVLLLFTIGLCTLYLLIGSPGRTVGSSPSASGPLRNRVMHLPSTDAIRLFEEIAAYEPVRPARLTGDSALSQTVKLTATSGITGDEFGVAVAADADTAVIGAHFATVEGKPKQGVVYVFVHTGDTWVQQARLQANDGAAGDEFGGAIAVDADTILVGARNGNGKEGAAYIFVRNDGGLWSQQQKLTASTNSTGVDLFGAAVAVQGDTAIVGADRAATNSGRSGAAYIFRRSSTMWTLQQRIVATETVAGDQFGSAVGLSITAEQTTAIIGAPQTKIGNKPAQGAAYIFTRNNETWLPQARLIAADGAISDTFGVSVAVDGNTALIGAYKAVVGGKPERGAAYVFVRNTDRKWTQQTRLIANGGAGRDWFGAAVALDGDRAIVGARYVNVAGKDNQGAAYLFMRSGATWVQWARLVADEGAVGDELGVDVALAGDTALVGAYHADIDVPQDDRGAAYLFPVEPIPVDLTLAVAANPSALVLPSQVLVYTLHYGNSGGIDATGVTVTATVPEHTHFSANGSSNGWSCSDGSGPNTICTTTVGVVAAKGSGKLTFAVTVDPALPLEVTQIVADTFIVDDGAHGADLIAQNNQGFAYTPVAVTPLVINKTVTPTIAQPGDIVTYTIAITASQSADKVVLTDTLPPGMSFAGLVSGPGLFHPNPPQIRFAGPLTAGSTTQIVYRATIDAGVASGSILFNETLVTSEGQQYAGAAGVTVQGAKPVHTLMLIYVNGDNNLGAHTVDLFQKAETAAGAPGLITLLLLDGPDNDDAYMYLLKNDSDQKENCPTAANPTCKGRYLDNVNRWRWGEAVSTYTSLKEFVTGAVQAYPAERVLLALVGHGGGWSPDLRPGQPPFHDEKPSGDPLGGLLWDDHPSSSLSTADLGLALRASKTETGHQIDLLYLDACLMAMSEVAYEVQDSVDYLLASENWSWTSFRYDKHLAIDPQLSVAELGSQWIQNEADELRGDDVTRTNYPFTYSLLDLRAMAMLLEKANGLAASLQNRLPSEKSLIQAAFDATECFDGNQDYAINDKDYYCDLLSFAQQVESQFQSNLSVTQAAQELQAVIQESLVVTQTTNSGRPWRHPEQEWAWEGLGGVSIYLPLDSDDWKRTYYTAAHLRSAAEGSWDEFLGAYWGTAAPAAPTDCLSACQVIRPDFLVNSRLYLPVIAKAMSQK